MIKNTGVQLDQGAAHLPQVSFGAILHGQQWKIMEGDDLNLLWNILSCHHIDVIQPEEVWSSSYDSAVLHSALLLPAKHETSDKKHEKKIQTSS